MPGEMFKVSQSKVKTFRKCRRAYHNKYVEKLRRKRKSRPLMFGTLVHQMIEAYANGDDPFELLDSINLKDANLFAQEREAYGDLINDVETIMLEYFDFWESDEFQFMRKAGKSAEHKFEIEIKPGILFNGKIDAIGRRRSDKLNWLMEHKSFNRRPNADDQWRNLQSVSYFKVIDILGWKPVDGVCWDYIWSKAPGRPALLKDGKMSQKNIDTLPSMVAQVIRQNKLKQGDYAAFKDRMGEKRREWFQRIYTPRKDAVVEDVFSDFIATALEMQKMHGKVKDRNIDRHCSWCDYEPLCRAQMLGHDHEYIKEREYETNPANPDDEEAHRVNHEDL